MKVLLRCLLILLVGFVFVPIKAYGAWVLYDNFGTTLIDPEKWSGLESPGTGVIINEVVREIKSNQLHLINRSYGDTSSDNGFAFGAHRLAIIDGGDIKGIKATVQVKKYEVVGCTTNILATQAGGRIGGGFFNKAIPTPGNATNDVFAVIGIQRQSTSTDSSNVLEVFSKVFLCTNASCSSQTILGSEVLGTTNLNKKTQLRVEWDQPNHRFIFQRGTDPEVYISYAVSDTQPPGAPLGGLKRLEITHVLPNCTSGSGSIAFMEANFDDVYVNE